MEIIVNDRGDKFETNCCYGSLYSNIRGRIVHMNRKQSVVAGFV